MWITQAVIHSWIPLHGPIRASVLSSHIDSVSVAIIICYAAQLCNAVSRYLARSFLASILPGLFLLCYHSPIESLLCFPSSLQQNTHLIPLTKTLSHSPSIQFIVCSRRIRGMRPCCASRRVSRELGKSNSCSACICITFLQFRSLQEQNLSSCPAYSFPSCPFPGTQESLPSQLASLHAILAPRERYCISWPPDQLLPSPPVSLRLGDPRTLHAVGGWKLCTLALQRCPIDKEGDCNGIPTFYIAKLYRRALSKSGCCWMVFIFAWLVVLCSGLGSNYLHTY